jgi:hypothetical protein
MDQDWGKVGLTESTRIKKFEGDELVEDITSAESTLTKEKLEEIFADSAPGYNLEYARAILIGLQRKPIYGGTVTDKVKGERRARNARAKQSRRANRSR